MFFRHSIRIAQRLMTIITVHETKINIALLNVAKTDGAMRLKGWSAKTGFKFIDRNRMSLK